jgi:hypothetical protein
MNNMDVHKSVTVIVVINEQGRVESLTKIKTKVENFRDYFRGLSGATHVVFEEGGWSAWLYKLLKPLVSSVTVCETRHNKLIGARSHQRGLSRSRRSHRVVITGRQGNFGPVLPQARSGSRAAVSVKALFLPALVLRRRAGNRPVTTADAVADGAGRAESPR